MDQAHALRKLVREQAEAQFVSSGPRVITITSGKGGVGKTNFAANLAIHLGRRGSRVVILDADFGLANIEVLFGILPVYCLADVLSGEKFIDEVLTDGPCGVKFVSAGSGFKELANVGERQMTHLLENLSRLDKLADIIIIDTSAGISRTVVKFVMAADETILITTPEPTSITDAYALVKMVREESKLSGNMAEIKIVVNRTEEKNEGTEVYTRLRKVAERFLNLNLDYLGSLPQDTQLVKAVKKQQPVTLYAEDSPYSKAMVTVAEKLLIVPGRNSSVDSSAEIEISDKFQKPSERQGFRGFVKKFTGIFRS